ncbi:MAG: TonB-dependent receptor plug domain-containing protein, partial [Bacteroidaceae bacterium]|nr:TonB-dependent receptor plug domain-containing protein [Bacteroidaceae bacterium]
MKQRLFLFLLTIIIGVSYAEAQTGKISGIVISSEDNEPLLGATIFVKGTKTATVTDVDGKFSFQSIPSSAKTLVVSFIGMQTKEVAIKPDLKIVLSSDDRSLSEVVVTAMGVTKEKKALGYALQEVKGSTLTETAQTNLGTALSGKVAGMQVSTGGGQLGASQRITIRGNGSLGNNQPLIVVDGVPIANDQKSNNLATYESVDFGSGLNDIDPDNIESISVLKGPSAALYGMQAGNGVILVTTKKGKGKDKGVTVQYDGSFTVDEMYQIPKMQNSYGQGYQGAEYDYKLAQTAGYTGSYQEFAAGGYIEPKNTSSNCGYSYVDGKSGGVNDANDMSWGPRLDAGLLLTQFDSPLDANGNRIATPWVSHSSNIKDFLQTGYSQTHNISITSVKDNSTTRASLGYRNQKGTVPNTDLTKYTAELSST